MRDLATDNNGDLILSKQDLKLVTGKDLLAQKVRLVLSTNKNEWKLNEDIGIDFKVFLRKNPNYDEILDTITDGLHQVDETFMITEYEFKTQKRHLILSFKAINDSGEEISLALGEMQYTSESGDTVKTLVCALTAEEILNSGNALSVLKTCTSDVTIYNCDT